MKEILVGHQNALGRNKIPTIFGLTPLEQSDRSTVGKMTSFVCTCRGSGCCWWWKLPPSRPNDYRCTVTGKRVHFWWWLSSQEPVSSDSSFQAGVDAVDCELPFECFWSMGCKFGRFFVPDDWLVVSRTFFLRLSVEVSLFSLFFRFTKLIWIWGDSFFLHNRSQRQLSSKESETVFWELVGLLD